MKIIITRPLLVPDILRWADAHYQTLGRWPTKESGGIPGTVGETWAGVDHALRCGKRGMPGGSSLAKLLAGRSGTDFCRPAALFLAEVATHENES